MTATNDLAQRLAASTATRQDAELLSAQTSGGNVQGKVVGTDATGTTVETANGGRILVANPGGRTPGVGEVLQVSTSPSGGNAQIARPQRAVVAPIPTTTPGKVRYRLRPPTLNSDYGQAGDLWVDYSPDPVDGVPQGVLHAWLPTSGYYAQISGGASTPTQIAAAPPPGIDPANPLALGNTPTVNGAEWLDSSVNRLWKWSVAAGRYLPTGGSLTFRNRNPLGFAKAESLIDGDTILSSASGSEGGQWVWNSSTSTFETAHCCSAPDEPPGSFRYDQLLAIYLSWQGSDGCSRERMFEQDAPLPVDPGSASFFQDSIVVDGVTTWTAYINYTYDGESRQHEVTDIDDELGTESGPFTLCGQQFEYESQVPVAQ